MVKECAYCDWHGRCKRRAYAEVFPGYGSWSYLCRFHFLLAKYILRHKWSYGYWVITEEDNEEM